MIEVRALGPVDLRVRKAPAPAELLWKKNLALLVYLARSPKRARTREHLVGMLWGDKSEAKARRSLNEALRELRRSVGDGSLQSESAQVRVTAEAVQLDTDRLEALAAAGDYAGAASLVHGEFMEGFSVKGASEFDTWLAAEREHWRRRSVDVLVCRADQLLASGSVARALGVLERARALDWRRETPTRPGREDVERRARRKKPSAREQSSQLCPARRPGVLCAYRVGGSRRRCRSGDGRAEPGHGESIHGHRRGEHAGAGSARGVATRGIRGYRARSGWRPDCAQPRRRQRERRVADPVDSGGRSYLCPRRNRELLEPQPIRDELPRPAASVSLTSVRQRDRVVRHSCSISGRAT